ncbi:hypothetical protein K0M31_001579 [Melipona bicolor]|uniref:Uncharacterized protein n=1 Tax=Melipona bicolor TaxID=60889 RepID=A0AA40GFS6_9HYME|nr:hypothetical protein K0M31_001579 [Melipona bicolor]
MRLALLQLDRYRAEIENHPSVEKWRGVEVHGVTPRSFKDTGLAECYGKRERTREGIDMPYSTREGKIYDARASARTSQFRDAASQEPRRAPFVAARDAIVENEAIRKRLAQRREEKRREEKKKREKRRFEIGIGLGKETGKAVCTFCPSFDIVCCS